MSKRCHKSECPNWAQLATFSPRVMWLVSVTRSQVWMGSRCVKFGVIAHSLILVTGSSTWHLMAKNSKDLKFFLLHKDGVGYKKIAKTLKLSCSRWTEYSGLTGQVPLKQASPWSTKEVECTAQHHIQVCLGNRCMSAASIAADVEGGGGVSLSVLRPYAALIKLVCMAVVQKEASSKDDAQESPQTVCWRQAN